jgi:HSP20 family molecular chaperone IbpA
MVANNTKETKAVESAETARRLPVYMPETDIYETDEAIHIAMNVPGVEEKAAKIELDGDTLSVDAPQAEGEGVFKRSFTILVDVDREGIKAKAKDGVLRIKLPKSKKEEPKRIEIAVA